MSHTTIISLSNSAANLFKNGDLPIFQSVESCTGFIKNFFNQTSAKILLCVSEIFKKISQLFYLHVKVFSNRGTVFVEPSTSKCPFMRARKIFQNS